MAESRSVKLEHPVTGRVTAFASEDAALDRAIALAAELQRDVSVGERWRSERSDSPFLATHRVVWAETGISVQCQFWYESKPHGYMRKCAVCGKWVRTRADAGDLCRECARAARVAHAPL